MNFKIKLFICFIILNSQAFTIDQKLIPILFYQNSSKGGDWVYENRQLHIFGAGIQASYNNENWNISARFIQFGFLGNVNDGLFKFSPHQNFPYIDGSKDADILRILWDWGGGRNKGDKCGDGVVGWWQRGGVGRQKGIPTEK